MNRRILCVDDEENVLRAFERNLRSQYELETACGAERALEKLDQSSFAVVVSDLRMPGMDGVKFLGEVKRRWPDTVRLMLTGNADLESAMAVVNQDGVFQFLTKPCSTAVFRNALDASLRQYRLVTAERELLEQTLNSSIAAMTEVLSMVSPLAFSRAARVRSYVGHMSRQLNLANYWEFELAAMLSQIGCIAVPPEILEKVNNRAPLSKEEDETYRSHPAVAQSLLARIPRMEGIAEIIRYQMEPYKFFKDPNIRDVVAIGAQMLKIAIYFDESVSAGSMPRGALKFMNDRPDVYQPRLVATMDGVEVIAVERRAKLIHLRDLQLNMILNEDILTRNGLFIIPKGQAVSEPVLARLRNFARSTGIQEPFSVLVPSAKPQEPPRIPAAQLEVV